MKFLSIWKIFFWGGFDGTDEVPYVYIYDFRNDCMNRKTDMIVPRESHTFEIENNIVYVFGGYTENTETASCEKYDVKYDSWHQIENLPAAQFTLSSTKHKNSIYIVNEEDNCMF